MDYKHIYHERINDYYRFPRFRGRLEKPDFEAYVINTSCGDELSMQVMLSQEGIITQCVFEGKGCVISLATASMVAEYVHHKTVAEVKALAPDAIKSLIAIELGPNRLQCALLSLEVLHKALATVHEKK